MNQALLSTLSALAGTIVGGLTSFLTSWLTQRSAAKAAQLSAERARRDELYGKFIDELARVHQHAISEETIDWSNLTPIVALRGRIILQSSDAVAHEADQVIRSAIDLYMAPNLTPAEIRLMMDDDGNDPMVGFARACREELKQLR